MSEPKDGVIKYDRTHFERIDLIPKEEFEEIETWRSKLFNLDLIGEYPVEKVGFGNISIKQNYQGIKNTKNPQFIITGSATGKHPNLTGKQYVRILDFNIENQKIFSQGNIEPSSEALTHASIYKINSDINCVFHVHHNKFWKYLLDNNFPYTPREIPYGTMEMAYSVANLFPNSNSGLLAMAGHEDGIIAFGESPEQTGKALLDIFKKI